MSLLKITKNKTKEEPIMPKAINFRFKDSNKHKEFMKKALDDDISFQGFVDKAIEDYLEGNYSPEKEEDKMCKIVEVVELNENGVKVDEADNPYANIYFDDNGGLPDGNYNKEDIPGEWIVIDGQIEVNENITYAHVTCSNTTLVKNDFEVDFDKRWYLTLPQFVGQ